MKIKNNTILCLFALTTLAAGFGSCQSEDDVLNGLPQGSVPLVLGDVTVAGAQNVNNRAAGGNTRAAITEDPATGYTGIRKSRFVNGDVLNLTLTNGTGGSGGSTTSVTATLTGGKWVLTPGKVFITPGVTEISATHTATEQTAGIATDNLAAANADCTLTAATGTLAIAMKHAGAMIDITPGATDGATITSVTVNTDVPTAPEEEAVAGGSGTTMHYRTLTADATVVSSISAVIGGTTYVATLATPITVAANKRYPVALTFKHQTLTATPSAPQDWTDGGTVPVPGYTRIIDSPEALAQFAKDVNDDAAGTGARSATVIQTADLDMSQLKPAADAGTNPLTGAPYDYTATAENWVGIGNGSSTSFQGKYNGNGHTISNLKMTSTSTGVFSGLFTTGTNVVLTGIHLRNFQGDTSDGGAVLIAGVINSVISLCSATGTVKSQRGFVAGFIGNIINSTITRCSADVDVSGGTVSNMGAAGFAIQLSKGTSSSSPAVIAGCSSTGNVTWDSYTSGYFPAGFVSKTEGVCSIIGCYNGGSMKDANEYAFVIANTGALIKSCYSAVTGKEFGPASGTYTDCAYAGASTVSGVTGSITPATAYPTLTASNGISLADVKTLHWSATDGYTLTEVTSTWYATDIWKYNGMATPTIDTSYEGYDGPLYNGMRPNLLAIPGQDAYYVAPEEANVSIQWGSIDFSAICPEGWHVPTVDELVAMTGLPADNAYHSENYDAIKAAFPVGGNWWSSTEADSKAWCLYVGTGGTSIIGVDSKTTPHRVRCVSKK